MNKQPISRRNFLKIAGFAFGGTALACSGVGFLATRQPDVELITPQAEAFFAGKMELAKLSFLDRMIVEAMKGQDQDLRDWDTVRAWAREIANV